jgi:hypothetical protein
MIDCSDGVFRTSHSPGTQYSFSQRGGIPVCESLKMTAAGGTLNKYTTGMRMTASAHAIPCDLLDRSESMDASLALPVRLSSCSAQTLNGWDASSIRHLAPTFVCVSE